MKNSTINGEKITDELRRKIASRLRGKAKIATPDTVDSLLMEAVYGDDVMAVILYRDTVAFVSETMPKPGDTVTVKSSRDLCKDLMLSHRFPIE